MFDEPKTATSHRVIPLLEQLLPKLKSIKKNRNILPTPINAYCDTPQKSTIVYTIEPEVLEALWQLEPTTVEEALEEAELLTGEMSEPE